MHNETTLSRARSLFVDFLHERSLRVTPERCAILEKAVGTSGHFYADALHEALDMEGYHVSLTTVYSTLRLLCEASLLRRHQFEGQPAQYESVMGSLSAAPALRHGQKPPAAAGAHLHLVCSRCGRVREMPAKALQRWFAEANFRPFQAQGVALYVWGLCSRCQRAVAKEGASARSKSKKKK